MPAPSCIQVFRLGSTLPAAQLWDARDLYEANNARSDKVLRLLGNKLPEAVNACILAAGEGSIETNKCFTCQCLHPGCRWGQHQNERACFTCGDFNCVLM